MFGILIFAGVLFCFAAAVKGDYPPADFDDKEDDMQDEDHWGI